MAKTKSGPTRLSGKHGDDVHVNSQRYGDYIKRFSKRKIKEHKDEFNHQTNRTAFLNGIASELNTVLGKYSGNFKSSLFYTRLITLLRKEDENYRFLLLQQLKGLELNYRHTMNKMGGWKLSVKELKTAIMVSIETGIQPHPRHYANCHYYEVVLMTWGSTKKAADHSRQYSDWIPIDNNLPAFDFSFPKPVGTMHWLVCVRQQLGINNKPIELFEAQAMQIVDTGSFDKMEAGLLEIRKAQQQADQRIKKEYVDPVRVKARGKKS